jgi:defect-in-organelle-trafficking protein DotB
MAFKQSPEIVDKFAYRHHIHTLADLEKFLNHGVGKKASDIILQTNEPAVGLVHGKPYQLTSYNFQQSQIDDIASLITGNNQIKTALAAGRDYNHAFDVKDLATVDEFGANARLRFRLCATAVAGRGEAKQFVMRHIPAQPPRLDEVGFPEELVDEFAIQQGAFLIAGETGSGKTTTFAACIDHILRGNTAITGNIVTYEHPIEYVFGGVVSSCCTIAQSEIGLHVPTFHDGIVNAMRRKPSLIVVGELRDPATIRAANDAAVTGHPVFATVHANDSSAIIRRMVMQYDMSHQQQMFAEISSTSRLLMSQYLVERADEEGRVCLRDWIIVDPDRSEQLIAAGYEGHHGLMRSWMDSGVRARSMKTSIMIELEARRISEETARLAMKRYGYTWERAHAA